jgi:hypothetical protein
MITANTIMVVLINGLWTSDTTTALQPLRSHRNTATKRVPFVVMDDRESSSSALLYNKKLCALSSSKDGASSENHVDDETMLMALERLESIDAKLGEGQGATKERAKWWSVIHSWEETQKIIEAAASASDDDDDDDAKEDEYKYDNDGDLANNNGSHSVPRHGPEHRIAIFGGDPSRRRQIVEKRLAPYAALDQFGTPRDAGGGDISNLVRKIKGGKYDMVYIWTRFGCHNSRKRIRDACSNTGTGCLEIESLSNIRKMYTNE